MVTDRKKSHTNKKSHEKSRIFRSTSKKNRDHIIVDVNICYTETIQ